MHYKYTNFVFLFNIILYYFLLVFHKFLELSSCLALTVDCAAVNRFISPTYLRTSGLHCIVIVVVVCEMCIVRDRQLMAGECSGPCKLITHIASVYRWKHCTRDVNSNFGMAVSYLYVQKHFNNRSTEKVCGHITIS